MSKQCAKCGEWKPDRCFIVNLRDEVILTCISCLDKNETGLQFIGMTDIERKNYHDRRIAAVRHGKWSVGSTMTYIDHLKDMFKRGRITESDMNSRIKYFKKHRKDRLYISKGVLPKHKKSTTSLEW